MRARLLPLLPLVLLGGCNQAGNISGAIAGLATGAGTANPGVAITVGLIVNAGVTQLEKIYARRKAHNEQNQIAVASGDLPVGATASWQVHHTIPIGDEHGTVTVLDTIPNPLATCREVLFTVQGGKSATAFISHICLDDGHWTRADAEPAVERWTFLGH